MPKTTSRDAASSNRTANGARTEPTFNLKAVVQETNLKPDTLRAWERRYGLPAPERTAGGHRVYSQRDIDILKWLIARQDEGLSISRAVDLWNRLSEDGQNPLAAQQERTTVPTPIATGDTLEKLREAWISACLNFDEQQAELTLAQAFAIYPVETCCAEILQRGLAKIGQGWYEGTISAQQEHFASALAMRRLETLVAATPPPRRPGRILVGCPPEEEHTFGPLFLTLLLRRRSWDVVYLGANVPLERLEATINRADPKLVIFSAQTLPTVATLLPVAQILYEKGVPCAYGGLVFTMLPALQQRLPGHYLGDSLDGATAVVERILELSSPADVAPRAVVSNQYIAALQHFRDRQAAIEATVWEDFRHFDVPDTYLAHANSDFGRYIKAALGLGDVALMGNSLTWIEGLLTNLHYRIPKEIVRDYLKVYRRAVDEHLDERADMLRSWLDQIINQDR